MDSGTNMDSDHGSTDTQQNQKHQPGYGNIDEYQSELGELHDGRQPRYFQQNQKPERGHGNMDENKSELGELHDGRQPRYFQQKQKPERGHGSVSANPQYGQQPPNHFSDDLENEKPRHVQEPRKHVCKDFKRNAVRVNHQTRERNERYNTASPEEKTPLVSQEPLLTKIRASPNSMYPHTDQRHSIKSSKEKLKKYILDPTETMLLPDYFNQNIFVVEKKHDLTGCLECTWGSNGRRLTGAVSAERIPKCRHQGKPLSVISGWSRTSILYDSMEKIAGSR